MPKELLCTLGPSSFNDRTIGRLEELGVTLFRLNLSHTSLRDLRRLIQYVQSRTSVPLCLDTEGAQVRTGSLAMGELQVREHQLLPVHDAGVAGVARSLSFYPEGVIHALRPGDIISIDFDSVLTQVVEAQPDRILLRVLIGGRIGSNKAVTVRREIPLPVLTRKDQQAIDVGREMGIGHFALSFAKRGPDVDVIRRASGPGAFIIAKIECREAVEHLAEIAAKAEAILIDRGDLSRDEPVERIPALQKRIAAEANRLNKRLFVATNFLESMVTARNPTRAEVSDIYNTLLDGADGLVLAAETAIGRNPVACAAMALRVIREFEAGRGSEGAPERGRPRGVLVAPHGGVLVRREQLDTPARELEEHRAVAVDGLALLDCVQIAGGTYSPLRGFMDRETLRCVLERCRLPDGTPWPMPLILPVQPEQAEGLASGQRVAVGDEHGRVYALLDVSEVFEVDPRAVAKGWYGTDSPAHPGVARFLARGTACVAGEITLVKRVPWAMSHYVFAPEEMRHILVQTGLTRVVGFHTRNVVNRAHEHIQAAALERSGADGLYISPLIGPGNPGDFLPSAVVESYEVALREGFCAGGRTLFGGVLTYPRYCGPREAVFAAICRKNLGCSHFVVGRNHAGVGRYYQDDEYRRLFETLGDLGIEPIFFPAIGYSRRGRRYVAAKGGTEVSPINSAEAREALRRGTTLPEWYMRSSIQNAIQVALRSGRPVFHSERSPDAASWMTTARSETSDAG